jgi:hypothetical protein
MRGVHPSYLGNIDISVIGNSDPGVSGLITPFCETNGLFFNDKNEPEGFSDSFKNDLFEYRRINSTGGSAFIIVENDKTDLLRENVDECRRKFSVSESVNASNKKHYIKYLRNFEEEES